MHVLNREILTIQVPCVLLGVPELMCLCVLHIAYEARSRHVHSIMASCA